MKQNTNKAGRPTLPMKWIRHIRRLRIKGFSIREINHITGVSIGAIYKYT